MGHRTVLIDTVPLDKPVVLGINSVYHESSACIVRGNEVLALAEEERFNRRKHAKPAHIGTVDQIPELAIADCMARAGVTCEEIDYVAASFDPSLRRPPIPEPVTEGSWGHPAGEQQFQEKLARIPGAVGEFLARDISANWVWVPHEIAHAASAYYCSPFDEAAILCMDGIGEDSTSLLAYGTGSALKPLNYTSYPDSLGFVWEKLSKFTGMDEYSSPKLMALAAFASPDSYREHFSILVPRDESEFSVDLDAFRFRAEDYGPLEKLFGPARKPDGQFEYRYAQIAASLQEMTEEIISGFARRLKQITGSANLCLAGGVALNCVAMGKLLNEGPFDGVFVQPLAHDGGTALGAALWVANTRGRDPSRFVMRDPYLGSASFSDTQIAAALAGAGVSGRRVESPARTGADLVARGDIVGWFQGGAEVGPRALGNRSIVADPRNSSTKDLINIKVKHREYFRPFPGCTSRGSRGVV